MTLRQPLNLRIVIFIPNINGKNVRNVYCSWFLLFCYLFLQHIGRREGQTFQCGPVQPMTAALIIKPIDFKNVKKHVIFKLNYN